MITKHGVPTHETERKPHGGVMWIVIVLMYLVLIWTLYLLWSKANLWL